MSSLLHVMSFQYRSQCYRIELHKARLGNRHLRLSISCEGKIRLHIPEKVKFKEALDFLEKHRAWLYKNFGMYQARIAMMPRYQYINNEKHWYLGQKLRLSITTNKCHHIDIVEDTLRISLPQVTSQNIRMALENWYRQQAFRVFTQRVSILITRTSWINTVPSIRIRRMRRQWANCSKKGYLTFNLFLIQAEEELVDYVIMHELCHLAEFNHSSRFYALMTAVMPDWKERKKRLDIQTPLLLYCHFYSHHTRS